jgi:hypothetical protein
MIGPPRGVGGTTNQLPGAASRATIGPETEQRAGIDASGTAAAGAAVKRRLRRVARPTRAHIA